MNAEYLIRDHGHHRHIIKYRIDNSRNIPLTPIVLTLISKDDLEMKNGGFSDKEIKEMKMVRLFKEAYVQGALLTHSDAAFLLHVELPKKTVLDKDARDRLYHSNGIARTKCVNSLYIAFFRIHSCYCLFNSCKGGDSNLELQRE